MHPNHKQKSAHITAVLAAALASGLALSGNALAEDGVTNLTNATVITSHGTAANIAGQGTLATLNTVGTSQIDSAAVTAANSARQPVVREEWAGTTALLPTTDADCRARPTLR